MGEEADKSLHGPRKDKGKFSILFIIGLVHYFMVISPLRTVYGRFTIHRTRLCRAAGVLDLGTSERGDLLEWHPLAEHCSNLIESIKLFRLPTRTSAEEEAAGWPRGGEYS